MVLVPKVTLHGKKKPKLLLSVKMRIKILFTSYVYSNKYNNT